MFLKSRSSLIILTVTLMMTMIPPGSASILCVAPGGHVAIEDVNAECCSHASLAAPLENQGSAGIGSAAECGNCVDYVLMQNGLGSSRSGSFRFSGPHSIECSGACFSPQIPLTPVSKACVGLGMPDRPAFSPDPLRC